jgi:glutathione S-transferase
VILYYFPGACSLAVHIALIEAGTSYKLMVLDRNKRTPDGRDFMAINPRGYVPALELDDGTVLTENLAILTYIAHQSRTLLAADGLPRWRALEATSFMTTEVHGNFKPFFYPDTTQAQKDKARQTLIKHFESLATQLGDRPFLLGDRMTIADPYLFVTLSWAAKNEIAVSKKLDAYFARMKQVPSVAKALADEGLSS